MKTKEAFSIINAFLIFKKGKFRKRIVKNSISVTKNNKGFNFHLFEIW